MQCKKACIVINPRAGENFARLTDVLTVLAAAGWQTDIRVKEYPAHARGLAKQAAEEGYDLVVAYGGDGTLNQVINGVLQTRGKGGQSVVGLIPGGTANQWASDMHIPGDPLKAALILVESQVRKIDVGHIEVEKLTFPEDGEQSAAQDLAQRERAGTTRDRKKQSRARHYFMLTAGLGFDAAVIEGVSKPLKYRIGRLAFAAAAAKKLSEQRAFPIEIRINDTGNESNTVWKGEGLQILINNTRRYASLVEVAPEAHIDDGMLDICVITAGPPITTMQQIASLLLRRKPDDVTAEYFQGAHFTIAVPASIGMHLDGSAVDLKDYTSKSDYAAISYAPQGEQIMVTYRFDACPRMLQVAVPATQEHNPLFVEAKSGDAEDEQQEQPVGTVQAAESHNEKQNSEQGENAQLIERLLSRGRKVTVVATGHTPAKKTDIIVGNTAKRSTGENKTIAVRVKSGATVLRHSGEHADPAAVQSLAEGAEILVEGKQSKRGVISAKRVII